MRVALVHVQFETIHPFLDGNGRLSRALTNLLLLRNDYAYVPYASLDEIIEERKDSYYLALRATQNNHKTENEDITPWLNFLLDALLWLLLFWLPLLRLRAGLRWLVRGIGE